jgi:arylsulfatase A-like enzyme
MEQAGMWDGTTVLISSDHGYRGAEVLDGKKDSRIPFILKLAGQKQGRDYSPEFNTIVTSDLLLSILRGELQTPEAVSSWLDGRCSAAPSL